MNERAILIGLITPDISVKLVEEYLSELKFLAKTAGAKTVKTFTQRLHPFKREKFIILPDSFWTRNWTHSKSQMIHFGHQFLYRSFKS